mgnify:CR=1 FL=1
MAKVISEPFSIPFINNELYWSFFKIQPVWSVEISDNPYKSPVLPEESKSSLKILSKLDMDSVKIDLSQSI